jgi:hypothetical protein
VLHNVLKHLIIQASHAHLLQLLSAGVLLCQLVPGMQPTPQLHRALVVRVASKRLRLQETGNTSSLFVALAYALLVELQVLQVHAGGPKIFTGLRWRKSHSKRLRLHHNTTS